MHNYNNREKKNKKKNYKEVCSNIYNKLLFIKINIYDSI